MMLVFGKYLPYPKCIPRILRNTSYTDSPTRFSSTCTLNSQSDCCWPQSLLLRKAVYILATITPFSPPSSTYLYFPHSLPCSCFTHSLMYPCLTGEGEQTSVQSILSVHSYQKGKGEKNQNPNKLTELE